MDTRYHHSLTKQVFKVNGTLKLNMAVRAMSLPALLLLLVVFRCLHALTPGVLGMYS